LTQKNSQKLARKKLEYGKMLVNVRWRGRWKIQPIM
jgi:hypothetical protein